MKLADKMPPFGSVSRTPSSMSSPPSSLMQQRGSRDARHHPRCFARRAVFLTGLGLCVCFFVAICIASIVQHSIAAKNPSGSTGLVLRSGLVSASVDADAGENVVDELRPVIVHHGGKEEEVEEQGSSRSRYWDVLWRLHQEGKGHEQLEDQQDDGMEVVLTREAAEDHPQKLSQVTQPSRLMPRGTNVAGPDTQEATPTTSISTIPRNWNRPGVVISWPTSQWGNAQPTSSTSTVTNLETFPTIIPGRPSATSCVSATTTETPGTAVTTTFHFTEFPTPTEPVTETAPGTAVTTTVHLTSLDNNGHPNSESSFPNIAMRATFVADKDPAGTPPVPIPTHLPTLPLPLPLPTDTKTKSTTSKLPGVPTPVIPPIPGLPIPTRNPPQVPGLPPLPVPTKLPTPQLPFEIPPIKLPGFIKIPGRLLAIIQTIVGRLMVNMLLPDKVREVLSVVYVVLEKLPTWPDAAGVFDGDDLQTLTATATSAFDIGNMPRSGFFTVTTTATSSTSGGLLSATDSTIVVPDGDGANTGAWFNAEDVDVESSSAEADTSDTDVDSVSAGKGPLSKKDKSQLLSLVARELHAIIGEGGQGIEGEGPYKLADYMAVFELGLNHALYYMKENKEKD